MVWSRWSDPGSASLLCRVWVGFNAVAECTSSQCHACCKKHFHNKVVAHVLLYCNCMCVRDIENEGLRLLSKNTLMNNVCKVHSILSCLSATCVLSFGTRHKVNTTLYQFMIRWNWIENWALCTYYCVHMGTNVIEDNLCIYATPHTAKKNKALSSKEKTSIFNIFRLII